MSGMFEQVAYRPFKDIPLVTALPSNPSNGDMVVFTDSLSAGTYEWLLKYVAARASNKWVFLGGSAKKVVVDTTESSTAVGWKALATAVTFTIPVAGDYLVEGSALLYVNTGTDSAALGISVDGATPPTYFGQIPIATSPAIVLLPAQVYACTTSGTVSHLYYHGTNTLSALARFLTVVPVAIGG